MSLLGEYFESIWSKLPDHDFITERTMNAPKGGSLLELGCGPARTMAIALGQGLKVTGIDLDIEMINTARKKLANSTGNYTLFCGNFLNYYSPRQFDLVLCVENTLSMITDSNDRLKTFSVAYDSLRPGGEFLLWVAGEKSFAGDRSLEIPSPNGILKFKSVTTEDLKNKRREFTFLLELNDVKESHKFETAIIANKEIIDFAELVGFKLERAWNDPTCACVLNQDSNLPTFLFKRMV